MKVSQLISLNAISEFIEIPSSAESPIIVEISGLEELRGLSTYLETWSLDTENVTDAAAIKIIVLFKRPLITMLASREPEKPGCNKDYLGINEVLNVINQLISDQNVIIKYNKDA